MGTILINIYDDFFDGEETYMYIDSSECKINEQLIILKNVDRVLKEFINEKDPKCIFNTVIKLYDSSLLYPNIDEIYHFKRYNLYMNKMTSDMIDIILEYLNSLTLKNNDNNLYFISES